MQTCEAPAHVLFAQLLAIVKRFVREKVVVASDAKRIDVFMAPYWGFAIERLKEEFHPDIADGEAPEIPRYESGDRRAGSTAEVDFWTSKKVRDVQRSHLNYVVQDSKWEQSAAYHLDLHPRVAAFVKNQGLGFSIRTCTTANFTTTSRTSSCGWTTAYGSCSKPRVTTRSRT